MGRGAIVWMIRSGFAALILSVAVLGCDPPDLIPEAKIAKGESYASGQAKFDAFFEEVLDARSKVADIDGEAPLRRALAEGLGIAPDAAADQMLASAKERATAMKSSGGAVKVQLAPEAKIIAREGKDKGGNFTKALGETVKQGVESSQELTGLGTQIEAVSAKLPDLDKEVDAAFPDPVKRDEVKRELAASKEVLEKSRLRALAESGRALAFVVAVMRAVDTEGNEALASNEPLPKPKPPGGKWSGARPPAGKPAGKPKPKDDFDP